jgi:hypothetical protein
MSKNVGLWIDHESAFLVELSNGDETRKRMNSDVERHTRAHGGARRAAPGGVEVASENKADRRRMNQIKGWMREVITAVADADRIYILGPGEAKRELLREMEKRKEMGGKIVGMDSATPMTDNQIAAKIREYYSDSNAPTVPEYRRPPGA